MSNASIFVSVIRELVRSPEKLKDTYDNYDFFNKSKSMVEDYLNNNPEARRNLAGIVGDVTVSTMAGALVG
jgi:hypothetical protein